MPATQVADVGGDGESRSKDASQPRIRRRNRMITSCLECRRRKLKCDKLHPCTNCSKFSRDCMFLAPALDSVSQKKLNELKEKMGSLERVLEDDIARRPNIQRDPTKSRRRPSTDLPGEESSSDQEFSVPEDERRLEATPMAGFDAAYDDGGNEDVLDIGIRIGRLRFTERIGGMFRPRLSEEVAIQMGAPIRRDLDDPDIPNLPDQDDFVSPGPEYIAPGSGFLFGDIGSRRGLVEYLPSKGAADAVVAHYYRSCHFVARAVHWPSFQMQYDNFWTNVLAGVEPPPSLQALIFSVFFSGIASMKDEDVMNLFGNPKSTVLANFQSGTEVALSKANVLRTTKLETMQALIIYLIPMCRDAFSRAHSVLVGTAIRLGECMGLHRDPTEHFGIMPVEAHVRRILWFQLCFLDYHTADKQGPRPSIKREDYDTRFPVNIDDAKLMTTNNVTDDEVGWTDMTLSRLRFECCEMWRICRVDIERLHSKKISVTHALGKIESFRKAMEAKYHPILDDNIAIQRFAKRIMTLSIHKMHVAMLHRYHFAVEVSIPDRLRQIGIINALVTCEASMELYKYQDFEDWMWYNSCLAAWASAALLALEIFTFPNRREADRIWKVLDFVFRPEQSLPRDLKVRQILSAIRDRLAFYRTLRGLRIPVSMQNRLDTTLPIRRIRVGGADMLIPTSIPSDKNKSPIPNDASNTSPGPRPQSQSQRTVSGPSLGEPLKVEDASPSEWTFDNPHTFLVGKSGSNPAEQRSRTESLSPAAMHASPSTNSSVLPGLDTGHSPSGSSTNTESWPPLISSDQHGWRYAFQTPSPQQATVVKPRQMSASQLPPSSMAQLSPHSQQYAQSFGNPGMGPMPNMYMPSSASPTGPVQYVPLDIGEHGVGTNANSIAAMVEMHPNDAHAHMQHMHGHGAQGQVPVRADAPMLDINWAEWDKIFPPEINSGHLDRTERVR